MEKKFRASQETHIRGKVTETPSPLPSRTKPVYKSATKAHLSKQYEPPKHNLLPIGGWFGNPVEHVEVSVIIPLINSQNIIKEQIARWTLSSEEIIYVNDCWPRKPYLTVLESWEKRRSRLKRPVGKIVMNHRSLGFGSACNNGANYASGKYLVFLRPEVLLSPGWLQNLKEAFAKHPRIGVVGNAGFQWDGKSLQKTNLAEPDIVDTSCSMMTKEFFDHVGGFDAAYTSDFYSNLDLNLRVQKAGKIIKCHNFCQTREIITDGSLESDRDLFEKKWLKTGLMDVLIRRSDNLCVPKQEIVVYTAATKNQFHEKQSKDNIEFVAFHSENLKSKTWDIRPLHQGLNEPIRNVKRHKILSHLYFPDKEFSLWLEQSISLKIPARNLVERYLVDNDVVVFTRQSGYCVCQEAEAKMRSRSDHCEVILSQIERYKRRGYAGDSPLVDTRVILRKHTPAVCRFNEAWWEEIQNGSHEDQLSFDYVAKKTGLRYCFFPGLLRRTDPKSTAFFEVL